MNTDSKIAHWLAPDSSHLPGPAPAASLGEDKEYPSAPVQVLVGCPPSLKEGWGVKEGRGEQDDRGAFGYWIDHS